jgi:hypothetical protein
MQISKEDDTSEHEVLLKKWLSRKVSTNVYKVEKGMWVSCPNAGEGRFEVMDITDEVLHLDLRNGMGPTPFFMFQCKVEVGEILRFKSGTTNDPDDIGLPPKPA